MTSPSEALSLPAAATTERKKVRLGEYGTQRYKDRHGSVVPGVTTILGVLDKNLAGWYASVERAATIQAAADVFSLSLKERPRTMDAAGFASVLTARMPVYELSRKPRWVGDIKKDKGGDVGTVAHRMIETWLRGESLDESDPAIVPGTIEPAHGIFARFKEWWRGSGYEVVATEQRMVDSDAGFGGTADVVARIGGDIDLLDLKTSKASTRWPYTEMLAQTACYADMQERLVLAQGYRIRQVVLLRIGKDPAEPPQEPFVMSDAQRAASLRVFEAALAIYKALPALGKA